MKKQIPCLLLALGSITLAYAGGPDYTKENCPTEQPAVNNAAKELCQVNTTADESCDDTCNDVKKECSCAHCPRCGGNVARTTFVDDPFFNLNTDIFDAALREMQQVQQHIDTIMRNRKSMPIAKGELAQQVAVDIKDEDPALLEVIITLPGFDEKDISVNISSNDKEKIKILEVVAKKPSKVTEEKKDENKTSKISRSSTYYASSQSYVNGQTVSKRESKYNYGDGFFNWSMVLPSDIIAQDDYSMSFKDGKLHIKLKRNNQNQQTKQLKFNHDTIEK